MHLVCFCWVTNKVLMLYTTEVSRVTFFYIHMSFEIVIFSFVFTYTQVCSNTTAQKHKKQKVTKKKHLKQKILLLFFFFYTILSENSVCKSVN